MHSSKTPQKHLGNKQHTTSNTSIAMQNVQILPDIKHKHGSNPNNYKQYVKAGNNQKVPVSAFQMMTVKEDTEMLTELNQVIVDSKMNSKMTNMSPIVHGKGKDMIQRNYQPNKSVQSSNLRKESAHSTIKASRTSKSDLSNIQPESTLKQ